MPDGSTEVQRSGRGSGGITGAGFRPGASGNPAGRPRGIEELARKYTPQAIDRLVLALNDPDSRVAVTAAGMLLDRAWGKPKQEIKTDDATQSITFLHLTAARAVSNSLAAEREAAERQLKEPPVINGEVTDKQAATPIDLMVPALE
jgi:hypothetical protein